MLARLLQDLEKRGRTYRPSRYEWLLAAARRASVLAVKDQGVVLVAVGHLAFNLCYPCNPYSWSSSRRGSMFPSGTIRRGRNTDL